MAGNRNRESQWLVIRRCLAIICRLQRGPASKEELLQAVLAQEGPSAYGDAQGRALQRRLENDLARIKYNLGIEIRYSRKDNCYFIRDSDLPLLDLPDDSLRTLAFLEQTFGPGAPMHQEVQALLNTLRSYLAPERRELLERQYVALALELGQRDEDEIDPDVWDKLTYALARHLRVEFDYSSPSQKDGVPRRHVVDPYKCYFDAERGHYYLRGWCHYTVGPPGRFEQHRYFRYRLGRMANLKVLPDKLPPSPPPAPRYQVVYELKPQVARFGITRHPVIEITKVEKRDDGSALVYGETEDVFWAVRSLLHYGPLCRILGGPEMLREVKAIVKAMAELYQKSEVRSPKSTVRSP